MPPYLYAIPSIRDINPNLPPTLAQVDMNRRVAADSELHRDDLREAEFTAKTLSLNMDRDPLITREVVESAQLRARIVEEAHAQAEYGPGNIFQILIQIQQQQGEIHNHIQALTQMIHGTDQRVQAIDQRLLVVEIQVRISRAEAANARIIIRNRQIQGGMVLAPHQKTVTGGGLLLAEALATSVAIRDALRVAYQNIPLANIGDTPPFFVTQIELYQHSHILMLIAFYNQDFGISLQDTLSQRCIKFRRFLTDL